MRYVGSVSSEGGPLLIADIAIARAWGGADNPDDYERACNILESEPKAEGKLISTGDGKGLIWEMGGPGVSDVFLKGPGHLIIVRTWLEEPNDDAQIALFAVAPLQEHQFVGKLNFETRTATILWAPESGESVSPLRVSDDAIAIEGLSVNGAGLLVNLEPGEYQCRHDEITNDSGEARRLHLIKVASST